MFQFLCFLLVACAQSSAKKQVVPQSLAVEAAKQGKSFLTGADLAVWSKVDTTGANAAVLDALRNFFDQKMHNLSAGEQQYWIEADYERFMLDYPEIRYAEYGSDALVKYWPTLMQIESIAHFPEHRLANVHWASLDSMGNTSEVRYAFQFLLKPDESGVLRLTVPTEHTTNLWKREYVGEVTYVLSPKHQFSRKQAQQQQQTIEKMVDFFELDPFPITFYSFTNPTELLQVSGYLLHPNFFKVETGGRAGAGDVVYSGNNRDEYIHEVVHLFMLRALPTSTGLLNEGLATFLGGSSGYSYEWHLEKFTAWLKANPEVDLSGYLNVYQASYLEEDTSIPYIIGARLCEKLLTDHGKEVLFEALEQGDDPWDYLAGLGIYKENLRALW